MSISLDPRQVLAFLNGMGYYNIEAHQLKAFMKDLKRLIIYEEQLTANRKENQRNHAEIEVDCNCNSCPKHQHDHRHKSADKTQEIYESDGGEADDEREVQNRHCCQLQEDVFEVLHKAETAASRARKKSAHKLHFPKTHAERQVITLQVNKPCQLHRNGVQNILGNIVPPIKCGDSARTPVTSQSLPSQAVGKEVLTANSSTGTISKSLPSYGGTVTTLTTSKKSEKLKSIKSSKSSYIKPKVFPKPIKSDPVALYHQYKQEWDKIKFPGENQHGETRWAIREKLLGA